MEIIKFDKLVRNNIPDIIKRDSKEAFTHIAEDEEYVQKIKEKLEEEVNELLSSDESHEIEEVADILEVLYAFCDAKGISRQEIEEIRAKKAKERGGFGKRIILEETRTK